VFPAAFEKGRLNIDTGQTQFLLDIAACPTYLGNDCKATIFYYRK
jgi:hypothetical protein